MYDDQGLGDAYSNPRVNGLPVSQATSFNIPQMRMNWALQRMNGQNQVNGMPDFWGMQTGNMGQGQQAPFAPPVKNWLKGG